MKLFGTDGVRGVANVELTPDLALEIGWAGAVVLGRNASEKKILVAKDTRISGDMLEAALISGICSAGSHAVTLGVLPTPAVSYLVKHEGACGGVMISASHNPKEDNGIKFFYKDGFKISEKLEGKIEKLIFNSLKKKRSTAVGRIFRGEHLHDTYVAYLAAQAKRHFSGFKIVLDCANGALSEVAPEVFRRLKATVYSYNCRGKEGKINEGCGSLYPDFVRRKTLHHRAHLGISFDGDGDRLVMVDEKGQTLSGDHLLTALAIYYKRKGLLKNPATVVTVMSTLSMEETLAEWGISCFRCQVGDRNVVETMLRKKVILGGEQAGHIVFLNHNPTSDGLFTAIQVMNILRETGKSLSAMTCVLQPYPQVLLNAKVKEKDFKRSENVLTVLRNAEKRLGKQGRIFVRPSGTEPVIRVLVEGNEKRKISVLAHTLKDVLEKHLN